MDGQEPREVSGVTTALILAYIERKGGRAAVEQVLAAAGLAGDEEALRSEDRWFADRRRVDLCHAAVEVFDDPEITRRIGEAAIELSTGQGLKLALRGLGSPRLVYANIARANAKFNNVHQMTMLDLDEGRARLRNAPVDGGTYDPCDCQYNEGLLSCVPQIFGLPAARVRHPTCIGRGADECIFEVTWEEGSRPLRRWALAGLVATGAAVAFPALLPILAAVALAAVAVNLGLSARRSRHLHEAQVRGLRARVQEQTEAAELMMTSLRDVVSDLHFDKVLDRITENAQAAISGAEFALLVREGESLRCLRSNSLPAAHLTAIESWVQEAEIPMQGSIAIGDLRTEQALAGLAADPQHPVGGLCAAPLVYRSESIGLLVALTRGVEGFLPRDVIQLESYATQAAIALSNARLYQRQQELAVEDPLTGLFNHRYFHETVTVELDRCRRYGTGMAVATFDLDGFKLINDSEGHAAGDRVLRDVAGAIRGVTRRTDRACRVGGDEFAVVLLASSLEEATAAARSMAEAIDDVDRRIVASWGVAAWPRSGLTKDELLDAADQAMYEMKRQRYPRETGGGSVGAGWAPLPSGSQRAERLVCSSRLSVRLAPMSDPKRIAETVVEELLRSFDFDLVGVLEIEGDRLRTLAVGGELLRRVPELGEWEQVLGEGITGRAARVGEPVTVADTSLDPGFIAPGTSREPRSELAAPIRAGGRLWGVLNLEHPRVNGFEPDDLLFAETIAAACGAAIHRSVLYGELENAFTRTLAVLSDALEAKDAYTAAHSREVADAAERVAQRLGLGEQAIRDVSYAALLHDIGKIGISGEILQKPGPLTDAERREVEKHTVLGAKMLERITFFSEVHPMVRSSHERWDGRGYPDQLAGEEIPLGARIIAACDALHAMTSDRSYRGAMSFEDARRQLAAAAGSQFDPRVIEILLELTDAPERGDGPVGEDAPDRAAVAG